MTYQNPRDPREPNVPVVRGRPGESFGGWLPLIIAAGIAAVVIAMMYPRTTPERVGGTNNDGPSVQTVTPSPPPTTEPRPTQAPIQ